MNLVSRVEMNPVSRQSVKDTTDKITTGKYKEVWPKGPLPQTPRDNAMRQWDKRNN